MTTSGVYQSWGLLLIECDCGWLGWADACTDREDMTLTYRCGGCGHEEVEKLG